MGAFVLISFFIIHKNYRHQIKDPAIVCGKFQIPFWTDGCVTFQLFLSSLLWAWQKYSIKLEFIEKNIKNRYNFILKASKHF